tara:strand:+ start:280 stop:720 length:441 start_codon:yes stop_codon:yes gene_type:complete
MNKGFKYILISASLVGLGVASYFMFRNEGEDVGANPENEDGSPITPQDVIIMNTQGGSTIQVGDTIAPFGEYANVRSEMEVNDGWWNNRVREVYSPNPIGVVTEVNTVGQYVWYRVDMSDMPIIGNTAWDILIVDGYVRADVVKKS